jgi:hypothetical protein
MARKPTPLTVQCPNCGAARGVRCWSRTRRGRFLARGYHQERLRKARGEDVPESRDTYLRREIARVQREAMARWERERAADRE